MRAPPEQDTMTTGRRSAMARSIARVIFSPTTTPMLPPMNCTPSPRRRFRARDAAGGRDDGIVQAGRRDGRVSRRS
jgi:hypothetical protein